MAAGHHHEASADEQGGGIASSHHPTFNNETVRRLTDLGKVAIVGLIIWWTYEDFLKPWAIDVFFDLDALIDDNYGWLYGFILDPFGGPYSTGWYGALAIVGLLVGLIFRRLAEGAAAAAVLVVFWTMWTRGGTRSQYVNSKGEPVDVFYSESAQNAGWWIVVALGAAFTLWVAYSAAAFAYGHALIAAHIGYTLVPSWGGHATGHMHDRLTQVPWRIWKWMLAFLLVPPILHHIGMMFLGYKGLYSETTMSWIGAAIAVIIIAWLIHHTKASERKKRSGNSGGGGGGHGGGGHGGGRGH